MSRIDRYWIAPLFVLFMTHGAIYYLVPGQHYTSGGGEGWLGYVKYLLLMLALPALVRFRFGPHTLVWLTFGLTVVTIPAAVQIYWANTGNFLLLQFQAATLGFFFGPFLRRFFSDEDQSRRYIFLLLTFTLVMLVGEVLLGWGFADFSRGGFRGAGPFVNPNNTGIVVAILAATYHFTTNGRTANLLIAVITLLALALAGSKTAMVLYAAGAALSLPRRWLVVVLCVVIPLVAAWLDELRTIWELMELREITLESGEIRSSGISGVLSTLGDAKLTGLLFGVANQSVVDNAYLDLITFGGLTILSLFLFAQGVSVIACLKNGSSTGIFLHALLFLAMLTTNLPRLWPTGYLFWALVGISLSMENLAATSPSESGTNPLME